MCYFSCALTHDARREIIEGMVKLLTPESDTFEAIAFRGMSGALIAPSIADRLGKKLAIVRHEKSEVRSHGQQVECVESFSSYIIIDDFVAGGTTVRQIVSGLKKYQSDAQCVGVYCYKMDYASNGRKVDGLPITYLRTPKKGT